MTLFSFLAHEGHGSGAFGLKALWQWIGGYHLIFLHFPIALITLGSFSELLFRFFKTSFFDHSTHFLLFASVIFVIPTFLTGLSYSYGVSYGPEEADIFFWHRFCGLFTAGLTFLTVSFRIASQKSGKRITFAYLFLLLVLFISVNVTGYLGGWLSFPSVTLLP